jgi:hypothetical protein
LLGKCVDALLWKTKSLMLFQSIRQRAEVNRADQIALLEATRGQLVAQKMQLEKKIGDIRERQRRKVEADRERERLMVGDGRGMNR